MQKSYVVFHLNLAFSSIPEEARGEVIAKCYWPLLELIKNTKIPMGIELTGWTLHQIARLDPAWVTCFRQLLAEQQCELIGSGWTQLIGPLVPYRVNYWNQKLGIAAYKALLNVTPKVVLVNEMAYSNSLVDVYAEAGYQALIMDKNNISLALRLPEHEQKQLPTHARGISGAALTVLWSDSMLFQRLQRAVHGDIPISEYLDFIKTKQLQEPHPLAIYSNDAEVFDYRPGRFSTEGKTHVAGEWLRLKTILQSLTAQLHLDWALPSAIVAQVNQEPHTRPGELTSAAHPIPVKKQAKYNVNRWALAGRDNLWLNTCCHKLYQAINSHPQSTSSDWQTLCELWASDLRTHLTQARWQQAQTALNKLMQKFNLGDNDSNASTTHFKSISAHAMPAELQLEQDPENIYWTIKTAHLAITLNARRGLAISSLAFASQGFTPLIVTLNQGYFSDIELGADFYSGGVIVESLEKRCRFTDLEWVTPQFEEDASSVRIRADVHLDGHVLTKIITIAKYTEEVTLSYLPGTLPRPVGSVRMAILTFNTAQLSPPLHLAFQNGGALFEHFVLESEFDHSQAVSAFVSSRCSLGTTSGKVVIGNPTQALELTWDPAQCAAIPMLVNRKSHKENFVRILFSQSEVDDTFKTGGRLLNFALTLRPAVAATLTETSH